MALARLGLIGVMHSSKRENRMFLNHEGTLDPVDPNEFLMHSVKLVG